MDSAQVKQCCSDVYGSEAARFLLGDSFHPGGLQLTGELAAHLQLGPGAVVLDVASGRGTSALHISEITGCSVIGVDVGQDNVNQAQVEAARRSVDRVQFRLGDAESLPFESAEFDALICECAFCTFPDKQTAAAEFARVLKPGGRVGITDLTRTRAPVPGLEGLLAWIACIGDARPVEEYKECLESAGLTVTFAQPRDSVLIEMVDQIRGKIFLADFMRGIGKLDLPNIDLRQASEFARGAADAIRHGRLGYAIMIAEKPR